MNTNALSDVSILVDFPHLVTINLSKNQIPNLDAFASEEKLPKLQFLNLSTNKIK
jgi:Leucine-rich repeat (LRR) protein